jgi:hypothetical protein
VSGKFGLFWANDVQKILRTGGAKLGVFGHVPPMKGRHYIFVRLEHKAEMTNDE